MNEWKPHSGPQEEFMRRAEYEVLFGGAAGPGKTDCLIMEATRDVNKKHHSALLLRRTFPELQEIIDRCHEYYPPLGGIWRATENRWHFPSGATIRLGHMQREEDRKIYQGSQFTYVGFDELTHFTKKQYLYLHSRCRSPKDPSIIPMMRSTSNPGGPGHKWVKEYFVTITEPGRTYTDPKTGFTRAFIPALVTDNPTIMENDPDYIPRLMMLPDNEVQMLLYGSWDVFEGQAFPELNKLIHGFDPFPIPEDWKVFRAMDWGYTKPFSIGWYAIDYDKRIWRFASYYGCKEHEHNVGLNLTADEVAKEIKKIEADFPQKVRAGPACKEAWAKRKSKNEPMGYSVIETMAKEKVYWTRPDHDRIAGKHQIHYRLKIDYDEEEINTETGEIVKEALPMVLISRDDHHFWRTMSDLPLNESRPEDVDDAESIEDHIYEEFRLALMSRKMAPKKIPRSDAGTFQAERRKLIRAKKIAAQRGISLADAYRRA